MAPVKVFGDPAKQTLYVQLVDALNALFGKHPGFRAAHAKGVVCHGTFTPAQTASTLSRAGHFQTSPVPATVRFSNATGIPNIPDFLPDATPKGMAIRFHVPGAGDTDIVAHSCNGFPVSTVEEFLVLLTALATSGPDAAKPTPIEKFLASRPRTLEFLAIPKPTPASFSSESYFALNAFRFTNAAGKVQFARYFIRPVMGNVHLDQIEAEKKKPDFLFDELKERLAIAPIAFHIFAQIPNSGDPTHDGSIVWPNDRAEIELGTLSLTSIDPNSDAEQKKLIFDPTHLVDGIELGDDPLPKDREGVYAISYARRNP